MYFMDLILQRHPWRASQVLRPSSADFEPPNLVTFVCLSYNGRLIAAAPPHPHVHFGLQTHLLYLLALLVPSITTSVPRAQTFPTHAAESGRLH